MIIKEINNCRVCSGDLAEVLNLGTPYISDFLNEGEEGVRVPLVVGECNDCGLNQLMHQADLDVLYKEHYWYRSSLNSSMLDDLKDIVEDIESRIKIQPEDVVIDIGCNDGALFNFYTEKEICKVGFDPAPNVEAEENCDFFINDFFSIDSNALEDPRVKAKVITSIAMFYDLPDPNKFVDDITKILDPEGIWVIQFTDLQSMLRVNAVDNICQEHLEYYRLKDIDYLLSLHGLEIIDVSYNKVNGGSIRIFVAFNSRFPRSYSKLKDAMSRESMWLGFDNLYSLGLRINYYKNVITQYLNTIQGDVCGLAASTKGNTLLQILELDNNKIKAIGEINEDKFGLVTSGTNIPIVPEKEVLDKNPELIIILAWHFTSTFNKILKDYIANGGKVLYPLPRPLLISNKGKKYLDE